MIWKFLLHVYLFQHTMLTMHLWSVEGTQLYQALQNGDHIDATLVAGLNDFMIFADQWPYKLWSVITPILIFILVVTAAYKLLVSLSALFCLHASGW